jgi:hypothetical protein
MQTEKISNKPLKGTELAKIIEDDLQRMLLRDGLLSEFIGYGKVAYSVTVKLMMDNPMYPEHTITVRSRTDKNKPEFEAGPLKNPTADAVKSGSKRTRTINNPNLVRVKRDMAVTSEFIDPQDGRIKEREIRYTPEQAGVSVEDADVNKGAKDEDLGMEFEF